MASPDARRFWSKAAIGDDCWEWQGGCSGHMGYGYFWRREKMTLAHRISWEITNGSRAPEMVLHRCDNPKCVRPSHLFLGDNTENQWDMARKGRAVTVLTIEQVQEVKTSLESGRSLARRFGVSKTAIAHIRNGRNWRWTGGHEAR